MMFLKKTTFLALLAVIALVSACTTDNESADEHDYIAMPVTLFIPATDAAVTTRVGDPGTNEQFKLPKYAYIYIVCQDDEGNNVVVRSTPTLSDDKWVKTHYAGALATSSDSVYQYTGGISIYLPINRKATGTVYAAVSTVPLKGLPTRDDGTPTNASAETVRDYQYTLDDATKAELANIYSTPYNYRPDGNTYYGTMTDLNSLTPHLDIVLYHVAAKLDLMWNVDPGIQPTTAIKTMALSLPDAATAYIFKPLETIPTTTWNDTIKMDVGNQWYGRTSRYVVPMTGSNSTYTFNATLETTSGMRPTTTVTAGVINKNQPFTPWIRGNISVRN